MHRFAAALTAGLAVLLSSPAAQTRPLGRVVFPNSCSARAQSDFLRGVAWLHSFGYEEAIDAFRAAQRIDPGCAMAYWGESLAFNQALWLVEEPEKARAALARLGPTPQARMQKAATPRERGFLKAVEALWGAGDMPARARAYAGAMAGVAADNPADDEAQTFYALAILGTLPRGDASIPMRRQAGAIAEAIFARSPNHPGAAHYVIHAYDHGVLAAKALTAARAYAKIAPDASHALHMPAHTFVQLGLWDAAAATDEASWNASIAWASRRGLSVSMRDFHSLTWLHYEWTQQGRFAKAAGALTLVDEAMTVVKPADLIGGHHEHDSEIGRGVGPMALRNDRGAMRARSVIESERWQEMKGQQTFDSIDELFALGISSARLGDLARTDAAIDLMAKALAPGQEPGLREQAAVMLAELQALKAMAEKRPADAFAAMARATTLQSRMPKPIGRPFPVKGADELYGEMLLQAGRAREAVTWFERTLARTPNRSRALLGLARALAKTRDTARSRDVYRQFLSNWRVADPNLPELAEARAALR